MARGTALPRPASAPRSSSSALPKKWLYPWLGWGHSCASTPTRRSRGAKLEVKLSAVGKAAQVPALRVVPMFHQIKDIENGDKNVHGESCLRLCYPGLYTASTMMIWTVPTME